MTKNILCLYSVGPLSACPRSAPATWMYLERRFTFLRRRWLQVDSFPRKRHPHRCLRRFARRFVRRVARVGVPRRPSGRLCEAASRGGGRGRARAPVRQSACAVSRGDWCRGRREAVRLRRARRRAPPPSWAFIRGRGARGRAWRRDAQPARNGARWGSGGLPSGVPAQGQRVRGRSAAGDDHRRRSGRGGRRGWRRVDLQRSCLCASSSPTSVLASPAIDASALPSCRGQLPLPRRARRAPPRAAPRRRRRRCFLGSERERGLVQSVCAGARGRFRTGSCLGGRATAVCVGSAAARRRRGDGAVRARGPPRHERQRGVRVRGADLAPVRAWAG